MKSFQAIIHDVISYFQTRVGLVRRDEGEPAACKRPRANDDENEVVCIDSSPPKKPKLFERRLLINDENRQLPPQCKSASTQTTGRYDVADNREPTCPSSRDRLPYRAPLHVRSPHRRRPKRPHQLIQRSANIDLTSYNNRSVSRPLLPLMTSNLVNLPSTVDLTASSPPNRPAKLRSAAPKFNDGLLKFAAMGQTRFAEDEAPSQRAYEQLLGSLISDSAKQEMRRCPRPDSTVVDLTDGDDEEAKVAAPVFDLTSEKFGSNTPSRTTPVRPNVVTIEDSDDEIPLEGRPPRVGSLQERILGNQFMTPDLVSKGLDSYKEMVNRFMDMKTQLEVSAQLEKQAVSQIVVDLLARRLKEHAEVTESILIEDEEEDAKPPLTPQMVAKIQNAQNQSLNPSEVLVSKFKLDVRRDDFISLKNLNWLNDTIINFYLELIVERGNSSDKMRPNVYAFSTFFYPSLMRGYELVQRHTRKVDLFEKDVILVPIHLSVHWCMATIDLKRKQVTYYDSMLGNDPKVPETLLNYLISEHKNKKKTDLDVTGWSAIRDKDIPKQTNGSDCGVFACTFAEHASRRAPFKFSQKDMPYLRSKMCYEILTGKLLI